MKKFFFVIVFLPLICFAQELKVDVSINSEQLQIDARERLEGFETLVENYMNTNRFSDSDWEGEPINCSFTIFFNAAAGQTDYSAQIIVNSTRPIYNSKNHSLMLNLRDETWKFQYEKNQSLIFNPNDFNSLTSLLDFYAYIILGFDADSYNSVGGDQYFQRALDIAVYGSSSKFKDGWELDGKRYNRRGLVEDIKSAKYMKFREDFFDYHYNGIDLYSDPQYKKQAQDNIAKLVVHLAKAKSKIDPRNILIKVFFNAKAAEFVDYLRDYPDRDIWKLLRKVDSPHSAKYDEVLFSN